MNRPNITLTRVTYAADGTLGVLHDDNNAYCVTLEDPWNNNQVGISCIPTGQYKVSPHTGTHFRNVWILQDVPGRSAILIHAGNSQADTQGCILVGMSYVPDQTRITDSQKALSNLRMLLPPRFLLTVRDFQSNSGGPQLAHTAPRQQASAPVLKP